MSTTRDGSGLRKRQRGFAAVPNETIFEAGLSARELGVLVKVIALPEDWDLRMDWLVRQFPEGREAITTAIRGLRAKGFYRVERRRRDDGTFTTGVSVSDVVVPGWIEQHMAACVDQRTERPKFDVSLRVLSDGRVEDEPRRGPVDTPAVVAEGDEVTAPTANGFPVSGEPVSGEPVTGEPLTGFPDVQERPTTQTHTQTPLPSGGAPEAEPKGRRRLIPENWEPDDALKVWTREKAPGIPWEEVAAFRDKHRSEGKTFLDFDGAWRTWARNWKKYRARDNGRARPYRNPQSQTPPALFGEQPQIGDHPPASDGWDNFLGGTEQ